MKSHEPLELLIPQKNMRPACDYMAEVEEWFQSLNYRPYFYSPGFYRYTVEYLSQGDGAAFQDASAVFMNDNRVVGFMPLFLTKTSGGNLLFSHSETIAYPHFRDELPLKVLTKLKSECLSYLKNVCDACLVSGAKLKVPAKSFERNFVIDVLSLSSETIPMLELGVNFSTGSPHFSQAIRKSYRSLANRALEKWSVSILRAPSSQEWQEAIELHFEVAGRRTRSSESWEFQRSLLNSDRALAIMAKRDNKLDGFAYFDKTESEAFYAVGVYRRGPEYSGLANAIMLRSLQHLEKIGIKFCHLGRFDLGSDDEKLLNISKFKAGYANNVELVTVAKL